MLKPISIHKNRGYVGFISVNNSVQWPRAILISVSIFIRLQDNWPNSPELSIIFYFLTVAPNYEIISYFIDLDD